MRLEQINREEIAICVDIFIAAFNNEVWHEEWSQTSAKKRLCNIMDTPDSLCYFIIRDKQTIGFIFGIIEPLCDKNEYTIREFCITNSIQGNGYGKHALELLRKELKNHNIDSIILQTINNSRTVGFYKKCGYDFSKYVSLSQEI